MRGGCGLARADGLGQPSRSCVVGLGRQHNRHCVADWVTGGKRIVPAAEIRETVDRLGLRRTEPAAILVVQAIDTDHTPTRRRSPWTGSICLTVTLLLRYVQGPQPWSTDAPACWSRG